MAKKKEKEKSASARTTPPPRIPGISAEDWQRYLDDPNKKTREEIIKEWDKEIDRTKDYRTIWLGNYTVRVPNLPKFELPKAMRKMFGESFTFGPLYCETRVMDDGTLRDFHYYYCGNGRYLWVDDLKP